jgi:hypothetical protein
MQNEFALVAAISDGNLRLPTHQRDGKAEQQ